MECRKIKTEGRKIGDQERLTCQTSKTKERNVANNDEKCISSTRSKHFFDLLNKSDSPTTSDGLWYPGFGYIYGEMD